MSQPPDVVSSWAAGRPVDVRATLGTLFRGFGDPTHRFDAAGGLWRTCRTPAGPATLHLSASGGHVACSAWGAGAGWAVDSVPGLLGADDVDAGFRPLHPQVAQALHRRPGWRVPRTGLALEALVPAVIEQKVTGHEAFGGWRRLLHRFGERAPGPAGKAGMRVVPTPAQWAAIASWEWLQAGVSSQRSSAVVRAAHRAGRIEQTLDLPAGEADRRVRSIEGVGVWTSAEMRQRSHGDADAVSFGDFHVPRHIGLALTGSEVDDDGLAELLEPYRPHRYRVQRLLELQAVGSSRRAPRPAPRRHLPVRSGSRR